MTTGEALAALAVLEPQPHFRHAPERFEAIEAQLAATRRELRLKPPKRRSDGQCDFSTGKSPLPSRDRLRARA